MFVQGIFPASISRIYHDFDVTLTSNYVVGRVLREACSFAKPSFLARRAILMVVAFMGWADTEELLLEIKAEANAKDKKWDTASALTKWSKSKRSRKKAIRELIIKAGAVVEPAN